MTKKVNLTTQLQKHFHHTSFQPGQEEIIRDVLNKNDVLGVLPTGSGKSLCYQLPAKILPGTTVVVSPLISLMIDQVRQLKANHFKSVIALNSFMTYDERRYVYQNLSHYRLLYVSPELLQQKELLHSLKQLNIQLFVIDEAHCISQWGHEFRPDYLRLVHVINMLNNPPILALTATASLEIQQDILTTLQRPNIKKHIHPIDRPNIAFHVEEVANDQQKMNYILRLLLEHRVPTLIYFSSRRMTEEVSQQIAHYIEHLRISPYHGGMDSMDRTVIQQQFMNDQLDVICCTSAFGMGINKQNIRLVIHYHFPSDLESYLQEVGRAGRDGVTSIGLTLYSPSDQGLHEYMIQNEFPNTGQIQNVFDYLAQLDDNHLQKFDQRLLQIFDHNEVHNDFIRYQLEKHDIIKSGRIMYDQKHHKNTYDLIVNHIKRRSQIKTKKLTDMINWLRANTCLREYLYKGFQSTYEKPRKCCNRCGLHPFNWNLDKSKINQVRLIEANWEQKLKRLFFIGADDESRTIN